MNRRIFLYNSSLITGSMFLPVSSYGKYLIQKPDQDFKGVNVGVITYSFRSMPGSAEDLLGYIMKTGLGNVELMGDPAEVFAGAPERPPWKRGELTEEEKAERKAYAQDIKKFRLSASMNKFKKLGEMYNAEGVSIDIVKFPFCFSCRFRTGESARSSV